VSETAIRIRGARLHNLKGIDVDVPLGRLTVVTGVSGSGKSTLAFDTLYAEGQRRYVETFSAYARQFLDRMDRPDVDAVEGIPPAVAIDRTNPVKSSRSTVGTMTEILDHLKLLWAKAGVLECPGCGRGVAKDDPVRVADALGARAEGTRVVLWFPLPLGAGRSARDAAGDLAAAGFTRVLVGDEAVEVLPDGSNLPTAGPLRVVVDRVAVGRTSRQRVVDSLETAFRGGAGKAGARVLAEAGGAPEDLRFSDALHCAYCDRSFADPTPNLFSFNSPVGACPACHGFGRSVGIDWELVVPDPARTLRGGAVRPLETPAASDAKAEFLAFCRRAKVPLDVPWRDLPEDARGLVRDGDGRYGGVNGFFRGLEAKTYKVHVRVFLSRYRGYPTCAACGGGRLAEQGRAWRFGGPDGRAKTLPEAASLSVADARAFFDACPAPGNDAVALLLGEVRSRLAFLDEAGLAYLTLDRQARTLSGGEVQRVHLTTAIGSNLVNTLYVLDEPSIGLHPRDGDRLVRILRRLRDAGNTVVVVEHDPALLEAADHVIDMGPRAGEAGGRVVAEGPPRAVACVEASLTGAYLAGRKRVPVPARRRDVSRSPRVGVRGARENNLRGVDLEVPLGALTVLTGVSGSGKSTLAHDVLYLALRRAIGRPEGTPGAHDEVVGADLVEDVVLVDQSALGRTPRANAATYVGAWDGIRTVFSRTPLAKERGFDRCAFSFNVPGGRCERCRGDGHERVEMQFLSDVFVACPDCAGKRFRPEVCEVRWRGLSIPDVLSLTVDEAVERFAEHPAVADPLRPLSEVGLGYLRLGQPLSTLSGGEAQRVRLAEALVAKPGGKPSLYVFDEPTTGLHLDDVAVLLKALDRLVENGHGVLAIEHHLAVIAAADLVVDLGPEGGPDGGRVVARGTPEEVAAGPGHTATFLRKYGARIDHSTICAEPRLPDPLTVPAAQRGRNDPGTVRVRGAREHNLKGVDVDIPRDALVVVTGPSGSGKSTLAFDVVFAEGQRRYIESLSPYARQFVGALSRPDVDHVAGIPPTVAIEQRTTRGSSRSTVATQTEIAHFLRLLFAKAGVPHCPACDRALEARPPEAIYDRILSEHRGEEVALAAPVVLGRKGFHREVFEAAAKRGHAEARVDGRLVPTSPTPRLARFVEHDVDEVVARLRVGSAARDRERLQAALDEALALGQGNVVVLRPDGSARALSTRRTCPRDGTTVPEPDPKFFSHNSVRGWCPACKGLGTEPRVDPDRLPVVPDRSVADGAIPALAVTRELLSKFRKDAAKTLGADVAAPWADLDASMRRRLLRGGRGARGTFRGAARYLEEFLAECPDVAIDWFGEYATRAVCRACRGARLRPEAAAVRVGGRTLDDLLALPIERFGGAVEALPLAGRDAAIAEPIRREIASRVRFLERVGLGYLTLERSAVTLSGGEAQRIRLAASLGSELRGACYVLDEPTIGLHVRDNERLLDALEALRDAGNSLVVVEHDEDTIRRADHLIDLGPGGGKEGGRVVAAGPPAEVAKDPASPTGRVLARARPVPPPARPKAKERVVVERAHAHNLKDVTVAFPLGRLTAVTGVSGSGKSTLVRDVLYEGLRRALRGESGAAAPEGARAIRGVEKVERVLEVDQTPVGRTPRSVPATYLGVWDDLRAAFSRTPEARARGYGPGRFSFNVKGGRCEACEGQGEITVEMSFLPDVHVRCEACRGSRFTAETNEVRWHGLSPSETLALTFSEAAKVFASFPRVAPFLALMDDVGLGYLTLGQPATTLSGGEAQRLKLVTELGKGGKEGRTLYVLDEPTTGLHGEDVDRLVAVLRRFVDRGDTVVVIEHCLPVIASADHVVDLGPEGGEGGGRVVAEGPPAAVAAAWRSSHTGEALRRYFGGAASAQGTTRRRSAVPASTSSGHARSTSAGPAAR
jgi:excinuclease ABC subunit A